ncbi:MAG: glycosyltransferase, partial [Crocosphaera sp.]
VSGRAIQMNEGARLATGDFLCFLHGDTLVPPDLVLLIENTLKNEKIACGGFISLMTGDKTIRWGTSLHNYLKTYYASLLFHPYLFFFKGLLILFGDQVMFCRQSDFWGCGGFDETLPIMEDADLCLKLVSYGRICLLNRVVQSSDRRVAKLGAIKANIIYLWIGILWGLGVSATYLKRFYLNIR